MRNRKLSAAERKLLRAEEQRILANIDKLPPERQLIATIADQQRRIQDAKKAKVPEVGVFFMVNGKVFVDGLPYTEVQPHAGFRTYDLDHTRYWRQLQQIGAVPRDLQYDDVPRGRVTYEDSSRRFTLFADKCIIKSKAAVSRIMNDLGLPSNTKVLKDDHYRCPGCVPKRKKKQEEEDWEGI